jgi:hypothetical protein
MASGDRARQVCTPDPGSDPWPPKVGETAQGRSGLIGRSYCEVAGLRPVDDDIAYGVGPAIRMHGGPNDAWPGMREKVLAAQLLVVASSLS